MSLGFESHPKPKEEKKDREDEGKEYSSISSDRQRRECDFETSLHVENSMHEDRKEKAIS